MHRTCSGNVLKLQGLSGLLECSDKRSQAAAVLDDLLVAFDKLDELDKLPEVFCEANDLVKLAAVTIDQGPTCQRNGETENLSCQGIDGRYNTRRVWIENNTVTPTVSEVFEEYSSLNHGKLVSLWILF